MTRLFGEPTLILAAIRAIIVCAVAFGLGLSEGQIVAIYAVAETILALVNRALVTPVEEIG